MEFHRSSMETQHSVLSNMPKANFFPVICASETIPVMIAGYFGSGKLFLAGHGALYSENNLDNLKLLSNIFDWLSEGKETRNVGLFMDVDWKQMPLLNKLDINKSIVTTIDQIQDKDIICVSYFSEWPKKLTN